MFSVQGAHKALVVTAESEVEVTTRPVLEDGNPVLWPDLRTRLANPGASDLAAAEFIHASPLVPLLDDLAEYARTSFPPGRRLLAGVRDLTARIHADFIYDATATSVSTPLAEVWAMRRGVCQDFAHLEIGCLRSLGLAARYVSGYLMSRPPPGKPRLVGADASHAWMSVWTPTAGWVDFDPTNDMVVGEDHITCAVGRDFDDVSPLKGSVVGGGEHSVHVAVDVVPKGLSPAAASSPVMSL